MSLLLKIPVIISLIFFVCYSYQIIYIPIAILKKRRPMLPATPHRFAVLISARNESVVIADLLDSIRKQTYPQDLIHVFVIADNCTDNTADIARAHGATVYTRFNDKLIGKGYALNELLGHIRRDYPDAFDGFFVFDADNILRPDYIERMNEMFSSGYEITTSYRNSKNYGANWISAGYALWFLRESQYLNGARMKLGTSCAVSGTGFLFSNKVMKENDGWPFFLLVEDIQFSIVSILKGYKIGYCDRAELFDEQPVTFRQSWRQRSRWAKGYFQVMRHYGAKLIGTAVKGSFSALDMSLNIMPAFILSAAMIVVELVKFFVCLIAGLGLGEFWLSLGQLLIGVFGLLFIIGLITTITEWDKIHTTTPKKILALFTFPLFMFTYLPITFHAMFARPSWKPIEHTYTAAHMHSDAPEIELEDAQSVGTGTK